MKPANPCVLTINDGSSSIKFALDPADEPLKRELYGKVDRIGLPGTTLTFNEQDGCPFVAVLHKSAANSLIDWLEARPDFALVKAVGHRVVHGMKHTEPETITQELLAPGHRWTLPTQPSKIQTTMTRATVITMLLLDGIRHTDYRSTCAKRPSFGLQN